MLKTISRMIYAPAVLLGVIDGDRYSDKLRSSYYEKIDEKKTKRTKESNDCQGRKPVVHNYRSKIRSILGLSNISKRKIEKDKGFYSLLSPVNEDESPVPFKSKSCNKETKVRSSLSLLVLAENYLRKSATLSKKQDIDEGESYRTESTSRSIEEDSVFGSSTVVSSNNLHFC